MQRLAFEQRNSSAKIGQAALFHFALVCLFVCLLACSFACLLVCLFACLLVSFQSMAVGLVDGWVMVGLVFLGQLPAGA